MSLSNLIRIFRISGALCLGFLCALPAAAHDDDPFFALQRNWWLWAGSIPLESNPLLDETGAFCGVGQQGRYWYLAGTFSDKTTRSCTVPKGVKLLVPVVVTFCYPEEGYDDDASCIAYVNDGIGAYRPSDLSVKLDGHPQPLRDICEITVARGDDVSGVPRRCRINLRADRNLFSFAIAPDTIYGSDPGVWRANAARGYWAVIDTDRLAPGEHVVKLKVVGPPDSIIPFMAVTYHLTIGNPVN